MSRPGGNGSGEHGKIHHWHKGQGQTCSSKHSPDGKSHEDKVGPVPFAILKVPGGVPGMPPAFMIGRQKNKKETIQV